MKSLLAFYRLCYWATPISIGLALAAAFAAEWWRMGAFLVNALCFWVNTGVYHRMIQARAEAEQFAELLALSNDIQTELERLNREKPK